MMIAMIIATLVTSGTALSHELVTVDQLIHGMNVVIDVPYACDNASIMVIVKTTVTESTARKIIRESWAKLARQKYHIPVVFVMGRSLEPAVMVNMTKEQEEFDDVIMGDFIDSYDNVTLKTVFAFNWFLQTCPTNSHLVYVDDDTVLNPEKLISMMTERPPKGIACKLLQGRPQLINNDWFISEDVYSGEFPDFCAGYAVILDKQSVELLVRGAIDPQIKPKLSIGTVFIYSFVRDRMGIPLTNESLIGGPVLNRGDERKPTLDEFRQRYDHSVMFGPVNREFLPSLWPAVTEITKH